MYVLPICMMEVSFIEINRFFDILKGHTHAYLYTYIESDDC